MNVWKNADFNEIPPKAHENNMVIIEDFVTKKMPHFLGAGGRRFKSSHPDSDFNRLEIGRVQKLGKSWELPMGRAQAKKNTVRSSEYSSNTMLDFVRKKYGISLRWMAAQIGVSHPGLIWLEKHGLTEEQAEKLESAIREMGRDLARFEVPPSMRRPK